jgi:hypothetical protein
VRFQLHQFHLQRERIGRLCRFREGRGSVHLALGLREDEVVRGWRCMTGSICDGLWSLGCRKVERWAERGASPGGPEDVVGLMHGLIKRKNKRRT